MKHTSTPLGGVLALAVLLLFLPKPALAVIAPDFIIQVGSQIATVFAVVFAFFLAIFSVGYQYVKTKITTYKKTFITLGVLLLAVLAGFVGYSYDQYAQKQARAEAYARWLAESELYGERDFVLPEDERDALRGDNLDDTSTSTMDTAPMTTPPTTTTPTIPDVIDPPAVVEKNLFITNKELEGILQGSSDYIVLDARENIEVELGRIPGSTHIRFVDLRMGRWRELPTDKPIYVVCFSGIRGKEVATYLAERGLPAQYIEEGAEDWVAYGGAWEGIINFNKHFGAERYGIVFGTDTVKDMMARGVHVVDTRLPSRFALNGLPGSHNIPIMHTPTENIEKEFAKLPAGGEYITVCDGYVNCFDARITGIELERRGHTFLGRYNKPWDF